MSKQEAQIKALEQAIEKLKNVNLAQRCRLLDFAEPDGGKLKFRAFGSDMVLDAENFEIKNSGTDKPVRIGDKILIFHYLLCDMPINPTGELITFRDFSGGQFYWQPFLSRTVEPLVKRIGNNLEILEKNLSRFDWKPEKMGDFGAKVHTIGKFDITIVYNRGDEEFPAEAKIFFDSCVNKIFNTEDATVLASRICIGLL